MPCKDNIVLLMVSTLDTCAVIYRHLMCKTMGHRGRDRMVVGFTITYEINSYHH